MSPMDEIRSRIERSAWRDGTPMDAPGTAGDDRRWLFERVAQLEAALISARNDIREAIPVTKHEYTLRRLQMGEATITTALTPQETPGKPSPFPLGWELHESAPNGYSPDHRGRWVSGVLKCWDCPAEYTPNRSAKP